MVTTLPDEIASLLKHEKPTTVPGTLETAVPGSVTSVV
jgi:hypothetical protein